MTKTKSEQKLNLAAAFQELEEITAEFEHGEVDLEQGVEKFKRGLELAKGLKQRLSEIENEIEQVKVEYASEVDVTEAIED